jgi:hypothetical protein
MFPRIYFSAYLILLKPCRSKPQIAFEETGGISLGHRQSLMEP